MWQSPPLPGQRRHHAVQFYTDDSRLYVSVGDFLADGIAAGQPGILIAVPEHRDAIIGDLADRKFAVTDLIRSGDLVLLDAAATLDLFMVPDRPPDVDRFSRVIGAVIEALCRGRSDCTVRAYGEMVDVLWPRGHHDAAIRLEVLWNDLAARYPFSLLCGYAMGNFYKQASGFKDVCNQHTHHEILDAVTT